MIDPSSSSGNAAALPALRDGTAAIESAFLAAGQGLSHGLSAFGTLTADLTALGAALDGGATATAAADLGRMSRRLRLVADRMPLDGEVLGRLVEDNRGMRRRFDDLIADMRMMVIVSRSARLEAVVSAEQRVSVEEFSRTIDQQIGVVQTRLDACAFEHAKLTASLERGVRNQIAFDGEFHDRLGLLATDLDEALRAIGQRRQVGLALMTEAGTRARGIARSAGLALVSLQIGDTTRQRLEHVLFGLERADAMARDGEGDAAALLSRLQDAQLRDTLAIFAEEGAQILDAFDKLNREAAQLVAAGHAVQDRGQGGSSSFMEAFRARFDAALELAGTCDARRAALERIIGDLGAMLGTLDETLKTLSLAGEDLVIVAVNVGLNAARLGSQGRGLVTVAGELKRLSTQIAAHAEGLLASFEAVRRDSGHFAETADDESSDAPPLAAEAAAILEALTRDDAMIAEVLAGVERTGRDFDATVAAVTRDFETVLAETARLADVADGIAAAASDAAASEAAAQAIDALMLPLYSMEQERAVHAAVVGEPDKENETFYVGHAA